MKKYVLDTSVLIHSSDFSNFIDSEVIIPIIVLEELDKLKKGSNEAAKQARMAIRKLDQISALGEIHKGVSIDNNSIIRIDTNNYATIGQDKDYGDNHILACLFSISKNDKDVIFLTRDINLRIRARAGGVIAEHFEMDKKDVSELYTGYKVIDDDKISSDIEKNGFSRLDDVNIHNLYPNEFVQVNNGKGKATNIARHNDDLLVILDKKTPWGLEARNREQSFAIDLLMDAQLPLVTLTGLAGSGKTLVTLACALEMTLNKKKYDKIVIYRPIVPMGNDIGYTPGSIAEKLLPWFSPVYDAFEFLFSSRNGDGWRANIEMYMEKGRIEMNALTYIRGKSIHNAFIIIDESQNLTNEEMKTILTRVGNNTKIVLNGDPSQIDSRHLDIVNNGLTYVIEKFKDSDLAGHVSFEKGERSELATEAANRL